MEYVQKAIQLAIEGGWDSQWLALVSTSAGLPDWVHAKIFLDHLFWKSLGKSLGWTVKLVQHGNWDDMETMTTEAEERWKYEWHKFIDSLIEGKPANDFFKHLLE